MPDQGILKNEEQRIDEDTRKMAGVRGAGRIPVSGAKASQKKDMTMQTSY